MDDPDAFAALAGVVIYIGLPVAAMLLWWAVGRSQERRHLADLAVREAALRGVLALDPRPRYQDDPTRIYGFRFASLEIKFRVEGGDEDAAVKAIEEFMSANL